MSNTVNDKPLTPYISGLDKDVTALKQSAEVLRSLNGEQWNWSPNASTWSAVQVLDHLNKSGTSLIPRFDSAIAEIAASGTAAIGDNRMRYGVVERAFIMVVSPNTKVKVPVPPTLIPPGTGLNFKDVLAEFVALQDGLARCLQAGNGLDLTKIKLTSPVNARFKFCVGAYLEATIRHEQYHWQQVEALDRLWWRHEPVY